MRILQVIPFFTPEMGGSAMVAYHTAKNLAKLGHRVTVLTTNYAMERSQFTPGDFEVVPFPNWVARWGFYLSPGMGGWLRDHLQEFDIAHLHTVRTYQNARVQHYCRKYRVPYLVSAHGTLPVIVERHLPKRLYDLVVGRLLLRGAAACVAVSDFEVRHYQAAGVPDNKIHVIYNGLDLEEFKQLPAPGAFRDQHRNTYADEDRIVLYLGRIHKRKNLGDLVRAVKILQEQEGHIQLALVGPDEGERASLMALARDLALEGLHFHGPLYGAERLAALRDAAVVALPAAHEIFGLVPFEALMCGTPVVVADDCGAGQIIADTGAGWTVPYGEAAALADAIRQAMKDSGEAARRVESGQKFVRDHLGWDQTILALENVYNAIAG